jgi:hypothetical protein
MRLLRLPSPLIPPVIIRLSARSAAPSLHTPNCAASAPQRWRPRRSPSRGAIASMRTGDRGVSALLGLNVGQALALELLPWSMAHRHVFSGLGVKKGGERYPRRGSSSPSAPFLRPRLLLGDGRTESGEE